MARKHKTFGPLTYVSLTVAMIAVPIGVAFRIAEQVSFSQANTVPAYEDPDVLTDQIIPLLTSDDPAVRTPALLSLRKFATEHRYDPKADKARARAVAALGEVLKGEDEADRARAAEALGDIGPSSGMAVPELVKLLKHEDSGMRLAAASALLKIDKGGEARDEAFRSLEDLAGDPLATDRNSALVALRGAGEPGTRGIAGVMRKLLSNEEPRIRMEGVLFISSAGLGADEVRPIAGPLLKSEDPGVRCAAALVLLQANASSPTGPTTPDPALVAILERSALDTSLPMDHRVNALGALTQGPTDVMGMMAGGVGMGVSAPPWAWPALRRCGVELAKQLIHKNLQIRLDAAALLHMIDTETLAGKNLPASNE